IAPKGETAESRENRIRQYEDFFNATGMATPDDLEEFRSCQKTYLATSFPWNDMTRGQHQQQDGPSELAQKLQMNGVLSSGARTEDEGLYPIQHGYWEDVMRGAIKMDASVNKDLFDANSATEASREFALAAAARKEAAEAARAEAAVNGEGGGRRSRRTRRRG
ncbi:MAG: 3-phenylpropionate dioxygenase, partial [Corynebacterium casei]|nr:3-phenylpropionate dioxygenase [Corynebacterium casei]